MTKVKICGLTRPEDVEAVNRAMPDFAGFVFAPSRRQVTEELARELVSGLSPGIVPVGVFVDETPERVAGIAARCALKAVQLHGAEDREYIEKLKRLLPPGVLVIKALKLREPPQGSHLPNDGSNIKLLDAWHPNLTGGIGSAFDWGLAAGIREPYILAGGLTAENLPEALGLLNPWGVDVSSGVETDGKKDAMKIAALVALAKGESK